MARFLNAILIAVFLAGVFTAHPALAGKKADGKVEIKNSDGPKKNVVIRTGRDTLILRTDPDSARLIEKMIKRNKGRVIIRSNNYTYYPEEYYPYYVDKNPAYSVGRALGRDDDDD